jgi:hypothetical protein
MKVAMIEADEKAYSHILYLKPDPETIVEQVAEDSTRKPLQLDAATVHGRYRHRGPLVQQHAFGLRSARYWPGWTCIDRTLPSRSTATLVVCH